MKRALLTSLSEMETRLCVCDVWARRVDDVANFLQCTPLSDAKTETDACRLQVEPVDNIATVVDAVLVDDQEVIVDTVDVC